MGTGESKPPSWEDIQHLIDRVDQVCRESEALRMHAERSMRRRDFWPDWRHPARRHDPGADGPSGQPDGSPNGADKTL